MSTRLLRSGIVVSAMTLLSRMLGLARDVITAQLIGAGVAADVFFLLTEFRIFCVAYLPRAPFLRPLYRY